MKNTKGYAGNPTILDSVLQSAALLREPTLQGICKDCGNGTLNNELNPAFDIYDESVTCNKCGSPHLDLVQF